MKVSIVIPNWNGAEKLRKNLPNVLKVRGVDEVLVSDDGSTDNSIKVLEEEFPQVKLVKRSTQEGFSVNVNNCFRHASGDIIFLLNSDTSPSSDCLDYALPHLKDEKVFSVSCNVGGNWSWARWKDGFFWHYMSNDSSQKPHQTLWASGGSGIFKKKIWDDLGGLDELFSPFYEEDVDIGYRATKRGYINIFEPRSHVEHYKEPGVIEENYSKKTIAKTAQRNQLLFIWKNITDDKLFNEHWKALAKMLIRHPKYWKVFLAAYKKWPQIKKEREIEKKEQMLTDLEILNKY